MILVPAPTEKVVERTPLSPRCVMVTEATSILAACPVRLFGRGLPFSCAIVATPVPAMTIVRAATANKRDMLPPRQQQKRRQIPGGVLPSRRKGQHHREL